MIKKLFNPFEFIAGGKALIIGLIIILATVTIGFYSNTHFPDIISVKKAGEFPFSYLIIQSFTNWLVVSILFYLAAIILSKSKVRIIDIFGTQALARAPYILGALIGFSESLNKFSQYLLWMSLQVGDPVEITSFEAIIAVTLIVCTLLLTVWMITLMLNAYKVSANLKGVKLTVSFIIVFILAMVITATLSQIILNRMQTT